MKRLASVLLFFILSFSSMSCASDELALEDIASKYGTPLIQMSNGTSGSTVPIYRDGDTVFLLTAKHVVKQRDQNLKYSIYGQEVIILNVHRDYDLALISVQDPDKRFKILPIAKSNPARLSKVFSVGWSKGKFLIADSGLYQYDYAEASFSTTHIAHGNSGGALVQCNYYKTDCHLIGITFAVPKDNMVADLNHITISINLKTIQDYIDYNKILK